MPGSVSKVSIDSGLGEVKAWWTAVHAPPPTATSPAATASDAGSNSGASTTQTNDHADSSISPSRRPISSRAAPSRRARRTAVPAAKKTQSPGCGADVRDQPGALGVGEVLGDRAAQLAVLADQDVGQPAVPALLGPLLPGVELAARLRRRRRA